VGLVIVVRKVPFEFVDQQWGAFSTTPLVADRIFYFNFVKNGSVVEFNEEGVADGSLGGVVVLYTKALLLDAVDLGTEGIDSWVRGSSISAEKIWSSFFSSEDIIDKAY